MTVTPRFDEVIHQSTRLSIMGLLAASDWAEFSFVRDALQLSDSALSKHLSTLEESGYLVIDRVVSNHRRRARVKLTRAGRGSFEAHVAAIQQIVENPQTARPK